MIEKVLMSRIERYAPRDAVAQEDALAEILQHYVLAALARAGFFSVAQFHGGTFLRIVHGLERFSEDLDFVLKTPDKSFDWSRYLDRVRDDLAAEGLDVEVVDRSKASATVRKAFLKTGTAIGRQLAKSLPFERHPRRKVRIKLEIDTDPPIGSEFETTYLSFPVVTAVTVQTLESAFASKSHALLCRKYVKGRDWFDFLWYVDRAVKPAFTLLNNAVAQVGPWAGEGVRVTAEWYLKSLEGTVKSIDWREARKDVERFLSGRHLESIELWNEDFFLFQLEKLKRIVLD